jgi:hypothetical protein
LGGISLTVPLDVEGGGLVGPLDPVEVEQLRELTLAVVCEIDKLVGKGRTSIGGVSVGSLWDG